MGGRLGGYGIDQSSRLLIGQRLITNQLIIDQPLTSLNKTALIRFGQTRAALAFHVFRFTRQV
jgi:hypothetical protein